MLTAHLLHTCCTQGECESHYAHDKGKDVPCVYTPPQTAGAKGTCNLDASCLPSQYSGLVMPNVMPNATGHGC